MRTSCGSFKRPRERHCELEPVQPEALQKSLCGAIDLVFDIGAFDVELHQQEEDATLLDRAGRRAQRGLVNILDNPEGPEV